MTPGFVDGHTHFAHVGARASAGAARRRRSPGTRRCARVADATPVQGWVLGQGWDANGWDEAPHRAPLDAVQPGPVYLDSLDVHAAWVNSAALRPPDRADDARPFGGRIVRDATGEPTGLLLERAVELVTRLLPRPPADRLDAALREAQAEAHRLGVTGIHDVEGDDALARLRAAWSGRAAPAARAVPPAGRLAPRTDPRRRAGAARAPSGSPLGGVKMFLDGSLGSRTAWMLRAVRGQPRPRHADHRRGGGGAAMRLAADAWDRRHRARHRRCGGASRARSHDCRSRGSRSRTASSTSSACTRPTSIARPARASWSRCSRPTCSPTSRWWTATGAGAAGGLLPSGRCSQRGTALVFGSDVPVASHRSARGRLRRAGAHGPRRRPAGGWRPEERLGFDEVRPRVHGGRGARRGHAAPAGHARAGDGCRPGGLGGRPGGGARATATRSARGGPAHGRRRRGRDAAVTGSH